MSQPPLGTLIVIAKERCPGRVKTRLVPPLRHVDAAALAEAAIGDTLAAMSEVPARRRLLALDGRPGAWLPPGWDIVAQPSGGLDVRLAAAFAAVDSERPAVLVGMDTPQLRPDQLPELTADACLGPARDGGYWALGLRRPCVASAALLGVPMSRADTAAHQLARLRSLGLDVDLLGELTDVDTIADARAVAVEAPHTRFAAVLRAVDRVAADA